MKQISYKFLSAEINHGTEQNPNIMCIFINKAIPFNEANEETAKKEAYKGEYTIEEVEAEEPAPTIEERTAALEEAINLLLEGATE